MGRSYICPKTGLRKGTWTAEEDRRLASYIYRYGHSNWQELPRHASLSRCGKSCRLRWLNYLKPGIKRGNYNREEDELIVRMHEKLGNRWSAIAARLAGRTDNEIKNYWHSNLKKRCYQFTTSHEEKPNPEDCEAIGNTAIIPKLLPIPSPASSSMYVTGLQNMENGITENESNAPSDVSLEFGGDFWNEPFLLQDPYSLSYSEFSLSPREENLQ